MVKNHFFCCLNNEDAIIQAVTLKYRLALYSHLQVLLSSVLKKSIAQEKSKF